MSPNARNPAGFMADPPLGLWDLKWAARSVGATIDYETKFREAGARRQSIEFLAPRGKLWADGCHLLCVEWGIGSSRKRGIIEAAIRAMRRPMLGCATSAEGTCPICCREDA